MNNKAILALMGTITFGMIFGFLKVNAEGTDNVPPVPVAKDPAIAKVERHLPKYDPKIFKDKDVQDYALEQHSNSKTMLEHVAEHASFFDVVAYKELELYNVNTRESLEVAFWADGEYVPEALDELDQFMRDWRRNQVIDIDPELYLLMHDVHEGVGADAPIHLISGHRSRQTNDKLRAMGRGTAKKSQHVLGKAADIAIPGIPPSVVRKEALEMQRGGVGYYPKSGFVHVDTGRVRQW